VCVRDRHVQLAEVEVCLPALVVNRAVDRRGTKQRTLRH